MEEGVVTVYRVGKEREMQTREQLCLRSVVVW